MWTKTELCIVCTKNTTKGISVFVCPCTQHYQWKTKSQVRVTALAPVREPDTFAGEAEFLKEPNIHRQKNGGLQTNLMFHSFKSFSRKHIRISQGALKRSLCSKLREIRSIVSTSLPNDFHAFSIPFSIQQKMASHTTSSLLIQINSLRRNNNAFTSVI